jgi:hypothetical protein
MCKNEDGVGTPQKLVKKRISDSLKLFKSQRVLVHTLVISEACQRLPNRRCAGGTCSLYDTIPTGWNAGSCSSMTTILEQIRWLVVTRCRGLGLEDVIEKVVEMVLSLLQTQDMPQQRDRRCEEQAAGTGRRILSADG